MTNLYSELFDKNSIQNFEIFFDSIILDTKVQVSTEFKNFVIIEKIKYNYNTTSFESDNKGNLIDFGDTGFTEANKTNGNCCVDFIFNNKQKTCYIVGLSTIGNVSSPIIYRYDLNNNDVKRILSFTNITSSISVDSFYSEQKPFIKISDNNIFKLYYSSVSSTAYVLNEIEIQINQDQPLIKNYRAMTYTLSGIYKNAHNNSLLFEYGDRSTILEHK